MVLQHGEVFVTDDSRNNLDLDTMRNFQELQRRIQIILQQEKFTMMY